MRLPTGRPTRRDFPLQSREFNQPNDADYNAFASFDANAGEIIITER